MRPIWISAVSSGGPRCSRSRPSRGDDSGRRQQRPRHRGLTGINLDELIAEADLVITAEGAIDVQTPGGKVPAEVAQRASRMGVPVLAIAGSLGEGAQDAHVVGIGAIASIIPVPMPLEDAKERGAELLASAAERSLRMMALGAAVDSRMSHKAGITVN